VVAGYADNDGDVDFAVSYKYGVKILLNDGGLFTQTDLSSAYPRPTTLAFGDADDDDALDLAAGSGLNDVVELFLNDGAGSYAVSAT
jgi:hypothetical protein